MREPLWRSRPDGFDIHPATTVRQRAINAFIHLSEGTSNTYLLVTPAGRIIVNTGLGFEAPIHKRYFDAVDSGPIRYIILTQGHVDHVGGVDHFREATTEIVAHANNPAQQDYDARLQPFRTRRAYFAWAAAIDGKARPQGGIVPVQSRPKPTILVEDRFALELGGLRVELIGCCGAETDDSLLVWLPATRTCITGNVFGALFGHFPNLVTLRGDRYRDALRYVATLDVLLALDAEMLLPGHHGPVIGRDTIRTEVLRMRAAVLYVHDKVVAGMNAGTDVWTAMREAALPPELAVGEGYGKVAWSARAIWEAYAGWFHGRSTTELYPVPYWSVHPELARLAGGAEPLARAAAARATNAPVEALHLAEIALTAEPGHPEATDASLAAHRTLLAASTNFWETRWLEHEIRRLDGAAVRTIRITDLAHPILTDAQRTTIANAARVPVTLTPDAAVAAAERETGLSDFGSDDFRPRLAAWLGAVADDTRLGPVGRLGLFRTAVRLLSNRLRLAALLRRHPEIHDIPITAPIVVAGLPRSGTTHLLNVLATDPRLRSLPYWEALEPFPAAGEGPDHTGRDPRYVRALAQYRDVRARLPLLAAMHDMPPEHIHEEVELLDLDFSSYQLEWVCLAPGWRDHYLGLDMRTHYAFLKTALRALTWLRGPRRWVLKCPQHLEQLGPLIDTFPDATVVLTHRDPVAVIRSAITMMAYGERLRRTRIDLDALADYWIDRVERLLRACVQDRERVPAAQSLDVPFHRFMRDEAGTVARIYELAGLPLDAGGRARLDATLTGDRRGRRGQVIYDLAGDFGRDPAAVRARFGFYFDRFPIEEEG